MKTKTGKKEAAQALTTKRLAKRLKTPGRYRDAGGVRGLYLQVRPTKRSGGGANNASWILRYERDGRERWLGLGPLHLIGLAAARKRAEAARLQLLDGTDPLEVRRERKAAAKLVEARKLTFAEAARAYYKQHLPSWRSQKHAWQWLRSLESYAFKRLGDQDVNSIMRPDVLDVLEPIWATKTVTADRVRNRIESVIDWAIARGHRLDSTNPARLAHLENALPAVQKLAKKAHHAAMAYADLPAFMANLRQQEGTAPRALELLILTATRTAEVLGATWDEVDLANKTWVIPAARMKGHKEHRIPLAAPAIKLLQALPREDGNPYVFLGFRPGHALNGMALFRVLERTKVENATVHGFRSAFSDWAHEQTAHSSHVIEISLAHSVGNAVEKAYRRSDMLAKRVKLMEQWAAHCTATPKQKTGTVVPIRGGVR